MAKQDRSRRNEISRGENFKKQEMERRRRAYVKRRKSICTEEQRAESRNSLVTSRYTSRRT